MSEVLQMKQRTIEGFGPRLADLRRTRDVTQAELGHMVDVSQRVIAYYETQDAQPPGALLADLAIALKVSADGLLGLKPMKPKASPKKARLMKRIQQVEKLPQSDQRAVLKFVDALVESRRRSA